MKLLTSSVLAIALTLSASLPAHAGIVHSGKLNGEIQSLHDSQLTVQFEDGTVHSFQINPALATVLQLKPGDVVSVDGTQLTEGTVVGFWDNIIRVKTDAGKVITRFLTPEHRRYITYGDRVVIDPFGQVIRENKYQLTAFNLTRIYDYQVAHQSLPILASSPSVEPVLQPAVKVPVQGLW